MPNFETCFVSLAKQHASLATHFIADDHPTLFSVPLESTSTIWTSAPCPQFSKFYKHVRRPLTIYQIYGSKQLWVQICIPVTDKSCNDSNFIILRLSQIVSFLEATTPQIHKAGQWKSMTHFAFLITSLQNHNCFYNSTLPFCSSVHEVTRFAFASGNACV